MVATAFRFEDPKGQPAVDLMKTPSEKPTSSSTAPSIEDRLRQLKELRDKSFITPEEYEKCKAEILRQI